MIWSQGDNVPVIAHLWGGGGGGGGSDYGANGGDGSGGGYSLVNFTVNEGDVIEVAVGGPGLSGANFNNGNAGGQAGFSLTESEIFNLRSFPVSWPDWIKNPLYPFSSNFGTYLNNNGTWDWPYTLGSFSRSYPVFFPESGNYQFTGAAAYNATFYLDGVKLFTANDRTLPFTVGYPVEAGIHTLTMSGENRWYRFNNIGSLALTISKGNNFGGGRGGNSDSDYLNPYYGYRRGGGGGGGGGATVVLKNGQIMGVAGGGGGGGGASFNGFGETAPGSRGRQPAGQNSGQNGTTGYRGYYNYDYDYGPSYIFSRWGSGGGGGGGGGYGGGNGGYVDYTGWFFRKSRGYAGDYGGNFGNSAATPSGRLPGGTTSPYYVSGTGVGGSGNPALNGNGTGGYAALLFDVNGIFVNNGAGFQAARKVWIKDQNTWKPLEAAYVKYNGVWEPVLGSVSPVFEPVVGRFGNNPRAATPAIAPDPAPPTTEPGGFDGGGGGGSAKIICTKLHQLGLMGKDIYQADQAFGAELAATRPDIYNGYRAWADIVVDWMEGSGPNMMPWMNDAQRVELIKRWSISWAQDIATPWAEEMAHRMGAKNQGSVAGKLITAAGMPICKAVGMWQRLVGPSKKPAGFGTGAVLIAMFVLFKATAELGRAVDNLIGK